MLKKIEKEFERFKKKFFYSGKSHKQTEEFEFKLDNMPYEIYDKIRNNSFSVQIPVIKSAKPVRSIKSVPASRKTEFQPAKGIKNRNL